MCRCDLGTDEGDEAGGLFEIPGTDFDLPGNGGDALGTEIGVGPFHAMGSPFDRCRIGIGDGRVDLIRLKPCLAGKQGEHVGQVFLVETVVQLVQHSLIEQGSVGKGVDW